MQSTGFLSWVFVPYLHSSLRNQKAGPFGAAALQGRGDRGARSLDRSRTRARGVALAMAVEEAFGHAARHVRHESRAPLARTSTPSTRVARVIAVFRPPGHTRVAAAAAVPRTELRWISIDIMSSAQMPFWPPKDTTPTGPSRARKTAP